MPEPMALAPEALEFPRLRLLSPRRIQHQGRDHLALVDPLNLSSQTCLLPLQFAKILNVFDGRHTAAQIRERARLEADMLFGEAEWQQFLNKLDRAMILDGPTFSAYRQRYALESVRPAALAGHSYPSQAGPLARQLDGYFDHTQGAGRMTKGRARSSPMLRAILVPHIDFRRGGFNYSYAYRELMERSKADTFIILGVAHQGSRNRYALTRKNFATPLGLVQTDQQAVDLLTQHAGEHLFDDELSHRTEHSIEFQAIFLQHLLGNQRPFQIVPILVGSFHDLMSQGKHPIEDPEISQLVRGLEYLIHSREPGRTVVIGSVDMGHIGQEFGDPDLLTDERLQELRRFDQTMIEHAALGRADDWFAHAAAVRDCWRTCGLAATYTLLKAVGPVQGQLLKYDQAVDAERTCCVSFASLALNAAG